ncbi:alpha/beta hydrolase [Pantoea sp. KPR_PJ]|uniref:alpha/beta hydrolase n=1 Tax=Pantoea sp. KPR_PJ TaxID=2738375 RepID=UPI003528F112
MRSMLKNFFTALLALAMAFIPLSQAHSRPRMEPLGENIADRGSASYRFSTRMFISADGLRHYKVWLGVPKQSRPAQGFPVLYMLDGNAAMAQFSDARLRQMINRTPPVLVAIGYDTTLPFDVQARALDYTPPGGQPGDPQRERYAGGGSHAFRQLLLNQIVPWAEKQAASDPQRRALWGHSYGGLFVLDTLYNASWFTHYFSAAPSVSWRHQRIVDLAKQAPKTALAGKTLYLIEGDGQTDRRKGMESEGVKEADSTLIATLKQKGVRLNEIRYPGQTHGQLLPSSLEATLSRVSGVSFP